MRQQSCFVSHLNVLLHSVAMPFAWFITLQLLACKAFTSEMVGERHLVIVEVLDSSNNRPIAGATVGVFYYNKLGIKTIISQGIVTDARGVARVEFDPSEGMERPTVDVRIQNKLYHTSSSAIITEWKKADGDKENGVHWISQVKFTLDSVSTSARLNDISSQRLRHLESQALERARNQPDYWPPSDREDEWGFRVSGLSMVDQLIVNKRWELSQKEQPPPEVVELVREAAGKFWKSRARKVTVGEIVFHDNKTAMASVTWISATYTFVLARSQNGWAVIRWYLRGIS